MLTSALETVATMSVQTKLEAEAQFEPSSHLERFQTALDPVGMLISTLMSWAMSNSSATEIHLFTGLALVLLDYRDDFLGGHVCLVDIDFVSVRAGGLRCRLLAKHRQSVEAI